MVLVLVSGSNRGIGREIARQLIHRDCDVIVTSRHRSDAEAAAEELGAVMALELDVTDDESVRAVANAVNDRFGRLDVLVNNAGITLRGVGIEDLTDEDFSRVIDTNLLGAFRMVRAFLSLLEESDDPRIVNMSSRLGQLSGDLHEMGSIPYSVSKAGLNMLTVKIAQMTNVTVNSMCPGWVKTDLGGSMAPRTVEQGADTAVWLALDHNGTGGFFHERERIEW